jgi:hypothetical protein
MAFALFREAGAFSTPRRRRDFESRVKVPLHQVEGDRERAALLDGPEARDKLVAALTSRGTTCCDLAKEVFEMAGISQASLDRAKQLMLETGDIYPDAIDGMLADLTSQFNAIQDDAVINELQKECVAKVEDAGVGLALAHSVRAAFQQVRQKDLLAARIIALTQTFDAFIARAEAAHRAAFNIGPSPTRRALVSLVQHFESGGAAETALVGVSDQNVERLADYFEVPGASREAVGAVAERYITEAVQTRAVEESMH